MKKILSSILVFVVCLSLTGVAMATTPKPPASFCFTPGYSYVYTLAVKPGFNIKMFDGTKKFYSIQGLLIGTYNAPTVGSGYVVGNVFHFTLNSTYNASGTPYFIQAEGFWDLVAKTGTMYAYYSVSGNWVFSLTEVSCTDQVITYSQESGAPLLNEGSPLVPPNQ